MEQAKVAEGDVDFMTEYLLHFNLVRDPFPDTEGETPDEEILTAKESGAHIRRCLRKAGMKDQVFYAGAIRRVYSYSLGDPKLINKICSFAIQRAFYLKENIIYEELLADCLDLLLESKPPDNFPNDKRRHMRIETDLPGAFVIQGTKTRGMVTITNLSRAGIQLKATRQRIFKVRDRVIIDFTLDDEDKTKIRTIVVVKNSFGFFSGCMFLNLRNAAYDSYIDAALQTE